MCHLRRQEKDPLLIPGLLPLGHCDIASHFDGVDLRDSHNLETRLYLLAHQRFRGSHENDFALKMKFK